MICKPCREAGNILSGLNNRPWLSMSVADGMEMSELHESCEAPSTCPCHHSLSTDALNRERLRA
jgi:hypothetical protein